jgi:hypothetical protein
LTGITDKFDWKAVATSALASGVGAGMGQLGNIAKAGSKLGKVLTDVGKFLNKGKFVNDVVRGALGSAITQGIGKATGLQDKFSWAGVAAAGVGSGVSAGVSRELARKGGQWGIKAAAGSFGNKVASTMANTIAQAIVRSAMERGSFGDHLMSSLPSALGNLAGQTIGDAVEAAIAKSDNKNLGDGNALISTMAGALGDNASRLMRGGDYGNTGLGSGGTLDPSNAIPKKFGGSKPSAEDMFGLVYNAMPKTQVPVPFGRGSDQLRRAFAPYEDFFGIEPVETIVVTGPPKKVRDIMRSYYYTRGIELSTNQAWAKYRKEAKIFAAFSNSPRQRGSSLSGKRNAAALLSVGGSGSTITQRLVSTPALRANMRAMLSREPRPYEPPMGRFEKRLSNRAKDGLVYAASGQLVPDTVNSMVALAKHNRDIKIVTGQLLATNEQQLQAAANIQKNHAAFSASLENATNTVVSAYNDNPEAQADIVWGVLKFGLSAATTKGIGSLRAGLAAERGAFRGAYATNGELVQSIATRADRIGTLRQGLGNGPVAGTAKHELAKDMLIRYQRMFGDRGLLAEQRFVNGAPWQTGNPVAGSIRLDVVEGRLTAPTNVWDYKFGNATLSQSRITQIQNGIPNGTSVPVWEIKP